MHVITLETRLLTERARAALGKDAVAVAVFVDSLTEGVTDGAVVPLTAAQLAKGAKAVKGDASVEVGFALEPISAQIPNQVFQGGKKLGTLFELRKLFDRVDLLMPDRSSPNWIQNPRYEGDFLFELSHAFAGELNLGDNGTLYVFDNTAIMQCY